jgi:acetylornithine deacetylase/succinyl-diaminopimelate desuccinylase-like protein
VTDFAPPPEVVDLLQQMIRNRCVNDGSVASGEETRNVDLLESFFAGSGLATERHASAPGRESLVARIEGAEKGAPSLLLMGHTDVVPVNEDRWREDPFGGELIDGEIWGRGAIDMFNLTSSMAWCVRELARTGFKPRGDVIYLAVADEEAGGQYGAAHLLQTIPDAVRADYVITESGGFPLPGADGTKLPVLVAEKGISWAKLVVSGTPGHGSMPFRTDNALIKGAEVVRRLSEYRPPTRIHDSWKAFVSSMGLPEEMVKPLVTEDGFVEAITGLPIGLSRMAYSCSHTTIAPTVVHGGAKLNIIPDTIEIEVDIRTLPGDGPDEVTSMIRDAVGDLADDVDIRFGVGHPATTSPTDTPLWETLSRVTKRFYADSSIIPMLMIGATDARFFRDVGSVAYGFGMFSRNITMDDLASMGHGDDERIDVESLGMVTQLWDAVVRDLQG